MKTVIIPKAHPLYSDVTWVASARDEKNESSSRFKLDVIKASVYDDDEIVLEATNGYRLHEAKFDCRVDFIAPGLYCVAKQKGTILLVPALGPEGDLPFPECHKQWSSGEFTSIEVTGPKSKKEFPKLSEAYTAIVRAMEKNRKKGEIETTLNFGYVADVLADDRSFTVHIYGSEHGVEFHNCKRRAIVMPRRM